jgi:hypothetical protein
VKSEPRPAAFPAELGGYVPALEWMRADADEKRRRRASDELERRSCRP